MCMCVSAQVLCVMCAAAQVLCVMCMSAQVLCVMCMYVSAQVLGVMCMSAQVLCFMCMYVSAQVLCVVRMSAQVLCVMCMSVSAQVRAVLAGLRREEVRHGHRHHAQHTSHRRLRHPHAAVGQGQCTRHHRRHDVRTFPCCAFVVRVTNDRSVWESFVWEVMNE